MAGFKDIKVSRRLVLKRLDVNTSYNIPAGAAIRRVQFYNRTTNAVTGGLRVGTAAGGDQIVAATAVGSGALVEAVVASTGLSTSAQVLYISTVTAWNSAEVDVAVEYDELLDSKGFQPNAGTDAGVDYLPHDPV